MDRNGPPVYESHACKTFWHTYAKYARDKNALYVHVHFWPRTTVAIGSAIQGEIGAAICQPPRKWTFGRPTSEASLPV
jgi:hypothetical protein